MGAWMWTFLLLQLGVWWCFCLLNSAPWRAPCIHQVWIHNIWTVGFGSDNNRENPHPHQSVPSPLNPQLMLSGLSVFKVCYLLLHLHILRMRENTFVVRLSPFDSFHSPVYTGANILHHVPLSCRIPLCACTVVFSSTHPFWGPWAVCRRCLLWKMLQWTSGCRCLFFLHGDFVPFR